jgi:alpha-amylase
MRHICFYFQVHQPYRLKRYRFFDIGVEHRYFDTFENRVHMERIARNCYLPVNKILLDLIKKNKDKFKVSFSITGSALEQFAEYAPEVLESFKKLGKTGNVEFLAETYSHSLVSMRSKEEFKTQVAAHVEKIKELFDYSPKVFRNTELIYDNQIGESVAEMGFEAMLTEGAKHILGWKSPNVLYYNVLRPELKLLLKNYKLSDDIAFRFSNRSWDQWPLTSEKFAQWIDGQDKDSEVINLFMNYETFGEHQKEDTQIFEFLKALPEAIHKYTDFKFATPTEITEHHQPAAPMNVEYPISWADAERDITAWLGNEMQREAFEKLYALSAKIKFIKNPKLLNDWKYLQASDHFYYMSTKILSDAAVHDYFNPYRSPYEAFINFMNVLSDFTIQVNKEYFELIPENPNDISNKISEYEKVLNDLKNKLKETETIMGETLKGKITIAKAKTKSIDTTQKTAKAVKEKPEKKSKPSTKKEESEKLSTKTNDELKAESEKKTSVKKSKPTKDKTSEKQIKPKKKG